MMFSTRGDAHKFYKKIKKAKEENKEIRQLDEIKEIEEIKEFYHTLPTDYLINIKYRMEKENNGSGVLPLLVSSLPWLLFIFSKQIQEWLFHDDSYILLWAFIFTYAFFVIVSIIIHFREKSWASVHISILYDIIRKRPKDEEEHTKTSS